MMNFVNNWIRPITLTEAQNSAALDLPDGQYLLTVADSMTSATRHEVLGATVNGGAATFSRDAPQEWPPGSVIYCAPTAEVFNGIFSTLNYIIAEMGNQGPPPQPVAVISNGGIATLTADAPYLIVEPRHGTSTLLIPPDQPQSTRLANSGRAYLLLGGTIRISAAPRHIFEASYKECPKVAVTLSPDNTYVDITAQERTVIGFVVASEAYEHPDGQVRIDLSIEITDLEEGYLPAVPPGI